MNGVVFQTSTMMIDAMARSGLAVQASGCAIRCSETRMWLMTPN